MNPSSFHHQYPLRHIARFTIQAETPFHVGSGKEWRESDAGIVTDANGLPTIPGTSLAGVLRHAFEKNFPGASRDLFGFQSTSHSDNSSGSGSRLRFSFASIHDKDNLPVLALRLPYSIPSDPILKNAIHPTLRDHARHNQSSATVEDHGKFDDLVTCAGHRFSFELELVASPSDSQNWLSLLHIIFSPSFRLGGKSSRGLGKFSVVAAHEKSFDLSSPEGFAAYSAHDPRVSSPLPPTWFPITCPTLTPSTITLSLTPSSFWLFGGGSDPNTDIVPVKDRRIVWEPQARVIEGFSLPGSSLKGALRHRATFHAYAHFGHFAGDPDSSPAKQNADRCIAELFGNDPAAAPKDDAKDDDPNTESGSSLLQKGSLLFSDSFLTPPKLTPIQAPLQHHVSIDRFTGGARDQFLFDEEPLFSPSLPIVWKIDAASPLSSDALSILCATLDDLASSRLPLGGGTGRGHGFFSGTFTLPSSK